MFNKEYDSLDLDKVTSKAYASEFLEAGVAGEDAVFEVLKKYATNIQRDVVIWNKRKDFTSEVDFICELNGYVLLIEAKEWYGNLFYPYNKENHRVCLTYVNINGKYRKRYRMDPTQALGGFTSDLLYYLKPDEPKKDIQLLRYLVFTRRDLVIENPRKSSINHCYLDELEDILIKLKEKDNKEPYSINKKLPSWDYYFNLEESNWFKISVLNSALKFEDLDEPTSISKIDSLCYIDESNEVVVQYRNGKIESHILNREEIHLNSNKIEESQAIKFVKFNKELHE